MKALVKIVAEVAVLIVIGFVMIEYVELGVLAMKKWGTYGYALVVSVPAALLLWLFFRNIR